MSQRVRAVVRNILESWRNIKSSVSFDSMGLCLEFRWPYKEPTIFPCKHYFCLTLFAAKSWNLSQAFPRRERKPGGGGRPLRRRRWQWIFFYFHFRICGSSSRLKSRHSCCSPRFSSVPLSKAKVTIRFFYGRFPWFRRNLCTCFSSNSCESSDE